MISEREHTRTIVVGPVDLAAKWFEEHEMRGFDASDPEAGSWYSQDQRHFWFYKPSVDPNYDPERHPHTKYIILGDDNS